MNVDHPSLFIFETRVQVCHSCLYGSPLCLEVDILSHPLGRPSDLRHPTGRREKRHVGPVALMDSLDGIRPEVSFLTS